MGILVTNCPTLARDMGKIFDVYWDLGEATTIPDEWVEISILKIDLKIKSSETNKSKKGGKVFFGLQSHRLDLLMTARTNL